MLNEGPPLGLITRMQDVANYSCMEIAACLSVTAGYGSALRNWRPCAGIWVCKTSLSVPFSFISSSHAEVLWKLNLECRICLVPVYVASCNLQMFLKVLSGKPSHYYSKWNMTDTLQGRPCVQSSFYKDFILDLINPEV